MQRVYAGLSLSTRATALETGAIQRKCALPDYVNVLVLQSFASSFAPPCLPSKTHQGI